MTAPIHSARSDIPAGRVPPYKEFCRLLWRFRDESGDPAVSAPPWMYAIVFDDFDEAKVAAHIVELLVCATPSIAHRISASSVNEAEVQIAFADLEVLYAFVSLMSVHEDGG